MDHSATNETSTRCGTKPRQRQHVANLHHDPHQRFQLSSHRSTFLSRCLLHGYRTPCATLRQAGKEPTGGSGRGVVVVQVPARPFLRPAFEKVREGASRRFLDLGAQQMGLTP